MVQAWRGDGSAHRPAGYDRSAEGCRAPRPVPPLVSVGSDFRRYPCLCAGLYAQVMTGPRRFPAEQLAPQSLLAPVDPAQPHAVGPRTGRDKALDAAGCLLAAALGALFLSPTLKDSADPLSTPQLIVDVALRIAGLPCAVVAAALARSASRIACAVLGAASISATPAGLLALFSLAVHRNARQALLVAALWIPSLLVFAVYSPTTDALSVVLLVTPLAFAATAWGMFIRARRQLLLTLRERALRAEDAQRLHADRIRLAERTRIAREMHDVLGHRISLMALHAGALAFQPDLPPDVRETAELMRSTARQALEELRAVIGVLRDEPGQESAPAAPQPTLSDIPRLVEETRRAGAKIDFEMRVDHPEAAPSALGRDAYRIVQEALTNIRKHARGTSGGVRVTGAADRGLHVSVRNRLPIHAHGRSGAAGVGRRAARPAGAGHPRRRHSGARPGRVRRLRGGRRVAVVNVRVLLVDDDALVRAGLRMILSAVEDLQVVGEADDGARAVAAVREHRPDVVLMDIRMPEMDGIAATAALRRLDAPPKVIVLTTFQADEQVMSALRAGADGFLLKDTPPAEIVNAVRLVAAGDAMLSPSVTRTLLAHFGDAQATERRRAAARRLATLTDRERQVAVAIGSGASNARGRRRTVPERGDGQGACVAPVQQARRRQPGADRDRRARRRPVLNPCATKGLPRPDAASPARRGAHPYSRGSTGRLASLTAP